MGLQYFPIKFLRMIERDYDDQAPAALEWKGHNGTFVQLEGSYYAWAIEQFAFLVLAVYLIEDGAEEMDYE